MNRSEFKELYNQVIESARAITETKGKVYTVESTDVLSNFKRVAEVTETTPGQTVLVYLWKHLDAIRNSVLNGGDYDPEDIDERVKDCINYLILLLGLMKEKNST